MAKRTKVLCFSSFTYAYLDRARTLFKSLRRHHPSWTLVALVTDALVDGSQIDVDEEPFDEMVTVSDLGIEGLRSWLFGLDVVEACTAVKAPFLLKALEEGAHDAVVYMDPDTCLFGDLDPIIDTLAEKSIVLTPHQLQPSTNRLQVVDDEIGSLKYGIYNLGFLAVARSTEGLRFARWWNERLLEHCHDDVPNGLFVDQRWCDHVPVFFDGVHIVKDPGYNVASWNVAQRELKFDASGEPTAAGQPLRFCHFTKVGAVGDVMLRKNAAANFEASEIWGWYAAELRRNAFDGIPRKWWAYARYADGSRIEAQDRRTYRRRHDLRNNFPDPFASGSGSYQEWLRNEALPR